MLFDTLYGLVRVVIAGGLAYVALVVTVRLSGKRTLAKLNAFDLIASVALGSTLATVALSSDVALAEGITAFAVLVGAQFAVSWSSARAKFARRAINSEPVLVLCDGEMLSDVITAERLSAEDVRQAIRSNGGGAVENVAAVVLETDGTLSVITDDRAGSRSALVDVTR